MTPTIPPTRLILRQVLCSFALATLFLLCFAPRWAGAQTQTIPLTLQETTDETDFTTSQAWGDYDNDGDLDLVVGNGMVITDDFSILNSNLLKQLLQGTPAANDLKLISQFFVKRERQNRLYCNTDGLLRSCWVSPENDFTTSVAWGDMDNDGDLDLAVGNAALGVKIKNFPFPIKAPSQNRIYRNNGNSATGEPRFELVWSSRKGASTTSVAWGDYDNDGWLDLAAAQSNHYMVVDLDTEESPTYENEARRAVLYHNDTATTGNTLKPTFSIDSDFSSRFEIALHVAWVDVDNDSDLDLAVANAKHYIDGAPDPQAGNDGLERIYCNQYAQTGQARLTSCWSSPAGDFSTSMSWGDVDGNGFPDMAVGNGEIWQGDTNDLYFNYGLDSAGNLILRDEWTSDESDGTISVAFGDADGDGDLDLAAGNGNFAANQPTRVYCNQAGKLATQACWSSTLSDITLSVAWGDVDGDGALDLATGNLSVPIGQQNRLYHNNSARFSTHMQAWVAPEPAYTRAVAWGDMDGDHDLDLALANSGFDQLYCNRNGTLSLVTSFQPEWDHSESVAWGDMDGDHDLDLIIGNDGNHPSRLYRNEGTVAACEPTFTLVWNFEEGSDTRSLAWGDFDGDGDLDLAVGNGSLNRFQLPLGEKDRIYRNDGNGSAGLPIFTQVWESSVADATRSLAWGDVDQDGDLDLAVGNSANLNRLYRNDGMIGTNQALFTDVWSPDLLEDTNAVAWGDMDGDGDLDLAVGNTTQSSRVYCNEDGRLAPTACWRSLQAERTRAIAWGDMDGDGDLDLAVGNQEGPNHIYLNHNGLLTRSPVWVSDDTSTTPNGNNRSYTLGVAWGDIDGDGDLDLAVGNATGESDAPTGNSPGQLSGVYLNLGRAISTTASVQRDMPAFARLFRPGQTADAYFFSAAQIITASKAVSIPYQLFTTNPHLPTRIFPEYSLNGGGDWLPATPGNGGDARINLSAAVWPTGTLHLFVWNAEKDIIKSDNLVFRIRTQTGQMHSPILWPALGSQSPPFRAAVPWYVRVVDERRQPVANASLYANGEFITVTNRAGLVGPRALSFQPEQALVALSLQFKQPALRGGHPDGAVWQVYQTTLAERAIGANLPFTTTARGEQRLTTSISMPLVLFNLVVSIEWSATLTETQNIAEAMHQASDYLFDLTDGQMAFGQVAIYDNAQHWAEADIQFSAKNTVHPHAYVGGILSQAPSQVVRLGRAWDGNSGNQGEWHEQDGFRTLAHEFGHYGLSLYDEYFGYEVHADGSLGKQVPDLGCIGDSNHDITTDAINASAMDYQYTSSELSDQHLAGLLWGGDCTATAHWLLTSQETAGTPESTWDTIIRYFSDRQQPARWQLSKPSDRGALLPGPNDLPAGLPNWPVFTISYTVDSGPVLTLTVTDLAGLPFANAGVTLYKANRSTVIDQGRSTNDGTLRIFGAAPGDFLRSSSIDGSLAGGVVIDSQGPLTLTLEPVGNRLTAFFLAPAAAEQTRAPAYLRIVPEVDGRETGTLQVSYLANNFDQPRGGQAALTVIVSEPGSQSARFTQASYSPPATSDGAAPATGSYIGQLSFPTNTLGTNSVQVIGAVEEEVFFLQSSYRLQRVASQQAQTVYSSDGKLSLFLNQGVMAGESTYFIVTAQSTTPGPAPEGNGLIGEVYDITASGSLVTLDRPAVLTLAYDTALLPEDLTPDQLGLYWWNATTQEWEAIEMDLDRDHSMITANIVALGAYALMTNP